MSRACSRASHGAPGIEILEIRTEGDHVLDRPLSRGPRQGVLHQGDRGGARRRPCRPRGAQPEGPADGAAARARGRRGARARGPARRLACRGRRRRGRFRRRCRPAAGSAPAACGGARSSPATAPTSSSSTCAATCRRGCAGSRRASTTRSSSPRPASSGSASSATSPSSCRSIASCRRWRRGRSRSRSAAATTRPRGWVSQLDHLPTAARDRRRARPPRDASRAAARCRSGALATLAGEVLTLAAEVVSVDGSRYVSRRREAAPRPIRRLSAGARRGAHRRRRRGDPGGHSPRRSRQAVNRGRPDSPASAGRGDPRRAARRSARRAAWRRAVRACCTGRRWRSRRRPIRRRSPPGSRRSRASTGSCSPARTRSKRSAARRADAAAELRIAVVGAATAAAAREHGWPVDRMPQDFRGEALVASFAAAPGELAGRACSSRPAIAPPKRSRPVSPRSAPRSCGSRPIARPKRRSTPRRSPPRRVGGPRRGRCRHLRLRRRRSTVSPRALGEPVLARLLDRSRRRRDRPDDRRARSRAAAAPRTPIADPRHARRPGRGGRSRSCPFH